MENLNDPENQDVRTNTAPVGLFELDLNSTSPTMRVEDGNEESKDGFSSFENSMEHQLEKPPALNKQECLQILQLIIAVKREQTFCSIEDSQIFMNSYPLPSSSKKSHSKSEHKSKEKESASKRN